MRQAIRRHLTYSAFIHLILLSGVLLMIFPFLWMLTTSVKSNYEALRFPPTLLPQEWRFSNYREAWNSAPFGRYFLNSVIQAGGITVCVVITSVLAAYAFANMRFYGKDTIFAFFLATMMIPQQVTLIPRFLVIKQLHWYNTYLALIVPFAAHVFSLFMLRQTFMSMPSELYDAAVLDGCSRIRYLWDILVPLSAPSIGVVILLTLIRSWNQFLWPLVATSSKTMRTIQVGFSAFTMDVGTMYGYLSAAATIVIMPIVIVFVLVQRRFIEGIAQTGLKG